MGCSFVMLSGVYGLGQGDAGEEADKGRYRSAQEAEDKAGAERIRPAVARGDGHAAEARAAHDATPSFRSDATTLAKASCSSATVAPCVWCTLMAPDQTKQCEK